MRRSGVARRLSEARLVWDLFRSQREGAPGLARRQQARLAALVTHARAASRFYQRRYRDHAVGAPLRDLPPVTKPALMAAFDDWVTDPRVMRAAVEAFIADPARLGARLCDAYFVCSTSGTTGVPGRFVHDAHAVAVYRALSVRMFGAWWSAAGAWALARKGGRLVAVVGTGGHFAGEGWAESERRRDAVRAHAYSVISVHQAPTLPPAPGGAKCPEVATRSDFPWPLLARSGHPTARASSVAVCATIAAHIGPAPNSASRGIGRGNRRHTSYPRSQA